MTRTASLAERNAGKQFPIPVYDRGPLLEGAKIIGHARTAAGALRIFRRNGVPVARAHETNSRPPCYVPIV